MPLHKKLLFSLCQMMTCSHLIFLQLHFSSTKPHTTQPTSLSSPPMFHLALRLSSAVEHSKQFFCCIVPTDNIMDREPNNWHQNESRTTDTEKGIPWTTTRKNQRQRETQQSICAAFNEETNTEILLLLAEKMQKDYIIQQSICINVDDSIVTRGKRQKFTQQSITMSRNK